MLRPSPILNVFSMFSSETIIIYLSFLIRFKIIHPYNVFGEVRRLAYKIMGKNKINKESKNLKIARDKGVNSTNWLGFHIFYEGLTLNLFQGQMTNEDVTLSSLRPSHNLTLFVSLSSCSLCADGTQVTDEYYSEYRLPPCR